MYLAHTPETWGRQVELLILGHINSCKKVLDRVVNQLLKKVILSLVQHNLNHMSENK